MAKTKTVTVKAHTRKIKTSRAKAIAVVQPKIVAKRNFVIERKSMAVNDQILLVIGHATAHVTIAVSSVAAVVTSETKLAWQFTAVKEGGEFGFSCWFPKSAIMPSLNNDCYSLASWFKANNYCSKWIHYNTRHNILTSR